MVKLAFALVAVVLVVAVGVQAGPGVMDILKANIRGKSHHHHHGHDSHSHHGYGYGTHGPYPSTGYAANPYSPSSHYPSSYGSGYGSDPYAYSSRHNPYGYTSHDGYGHGYHHGVDHSHSHGHGHGHGHSHGHKYGGSSAAAVASAGGAAAAAAAASTSGHSHHSPHHSHDYVPTHHGYMSSEHFEHDHGPTVRTAAAASGTFGSDGRGLERSSYQRSTESLQNNERGHIDDDHYYNAQSYGKTYDDNLHEAYDKDDEDYEPTPYGFRKKKRKENYVKSHVKTSRESGSGVIAKDKHRSGYSKSTNKLVENVDEKKERNADGILVTDHLSTSQHIDDGDHDFYDNSLAHGPHHHLPKGGAAAAASASAGPGGVSTSAAAAGL